MVDRRDLAAVAALVLTEDGHDGRTYVVTGPEAISYQGVARALSRVFDRTVEFIDAPDKVAHDAALQAGAPEWLAHGIVEVDQQMKRGLSAQTTEVARVLLGREPYSIAEFAKDVAAAFL